MRRFGLVLVAVSILAVCVTAITSRSGAQERAEPQFKLAEEKLFGGKPVYMRLGTADVYFEHVRLGTIGGKHYFVGVGAALKDLPEPGKTVWVLQDEVALFRIVDNVDQLQKIRESAQAQEPGQ